MEIQSRDSFIIPLMIKEDRAKFSLFHYESLLSKVYRRDTRDSSSSVYAKSEDYTNAPQLFQVVRLMPFSLYSNWQTYWLSTLISVLFSDNVYVILHHFRLATKQMPLCHTSQILVYSMLSFLAQGSKDLMN